MAQPTAITIEEGLSLPRESIRFPIELVKPPGFAADDPSTWPAVPGRLEHGGGRLLYMPPSADVQQDVCVAVAGVLFAWVKQHPEFVVGANEAGMILGKDTRGADAAVWLRADVGPQTGKYRRAPPILAVEVQGNDQVIEDLREKARWYIRRGVETVWLVLPDERAVVVVDRREERRFSTTESLPSLTSLPDLVVDVAELFVQLA
jgi:Uma2 family endonuclease